MENKDYSTEFNFNSIFEGKILEIYPNGKCLIYIYNFFMKDKSDKMEIIGKYNSISTVNGVICKPIVLNNSLRKIQQGDSVLVLFLNGNPQYPYYIDGYLGTTEKTRDFDSIGSGNGTCDGNCTVSGNNINFSDITEEQLKLLLDKLESLKDKIPTGGGTGSGNGNNLGGEGTSITNDDKILLEGMINDAMYKLSSVASGTTIKDIIEDGIFSAIEKKEFSKELKIIIEEQKIFSILAPIYYTEENILEVEYTKYMEIFNNLLEYINPIMSAKDEDTAISGEIFFNTFNDYYNKRYEVLTLIDKVSKIKLLEIESVSDSTLKSLEDEKILIENLAILYRVNVSYMNTIYSSIQIPKYNVAEYIDERIKALELLISYSKSYTDNLMTSIKIGNSNMIINSNFKLAEKYWDHSNTDNFKIVPDELYDNYLTTNSKELKGTLSMDSYKLKVKDSLMFSCWIRCEENYRIKVHVLDSKGNSITIPYAIDIKKGTEFNRRMISLNVIKEPIKIAGKENRPKIIISGDPSNNRTFDIAHLKLENGDISTEWSAAREDMLEELENFKTTVSEYTSSITQTVDEIQLSVDGFQATTSQITDKVNGMTYTMEEFREQTSKLTILLDTINMTVADLSSKTEKIITDLGGFASTESIEIIKKNMATLDLTVKGLTVSVEDYSSKVHELEKVVDGKADNTTVTELQSTVVEWQATVTQLGGSITEAKSNITVIQNNINEIKDVYLADINTNILTMKGTMDGIENSLSSTNKTVEKLSTTVDGKVNIKEFEVLSSQYAGIKTTVDSVNTTVNKHTESISNINGNLSNLTIGGRNLFRKTTNITVTNSDPVITRNTPEAPNGFKVQGRQGTTDGAIRITNIISKNDKFVFSGFIKADIIDTINIKICKKVVGTITATAEWSYFKINDTVTAHDPNTNNFIDIESIASGNYLFKDVKVETGDKATDWSPAPEDIYGAIDDSLIVTDKKITDLSSQIDVRLDGIDLSVSQTNESINTVSQVANTANSAANTAQQTANQAKTNAGTAISKLNDIADDSKLTPNEKFTTKKEWESIIGEKDKIVAQATSFAISSTDYVLQYNTLSSYIVPLLSVMDLTSDISSITFRNTFTNYYNARQDILNAISSKAKAIAVAASDSATTAINNAKIADDKAIAAQNTANTAKTNAETALTGLNNMSSDSKITPTEKLQLDLKGQEIIKEKPSLLTQAGVFSISTAVYETKYNSLYDYLYGTNGILLVKNTTTDIIRATFTAKFTEYYTERQNVLNLVAQKAKAASDKALEDSKKYTDDLKNTVNTKFTKVEADIKLNADSIALKVESTDIAKAINDNNVVVDSKIATAKSEIKLETDKINLNVNNLTTTVSNKADTSELKTVSDKAAALDISLQGITQRVSNTESTTTNLTTSVSAAQADATRALTNASNAQNSANSANSAMADMSNDNKLTSNEKHATKKEWDIIAGEKPRIDAEATKFGVVLTTYATEYTNLNTYLTPLLTDLSATSNITGTEFRTKFANYYNARQDVLNGITTKSKLLADTAQAGANSALTNAQTAQNTANAAQTSASTANSALADMSNDNKLSPIEKHSTKKEWDIIVGEKPKIDAEGTRFGISTAAYIATYNDLNTYITPLIADLATTTAITGTEFRTKFANYYGSRQDVLNGITSKSKQLADAAQNTANAAQNNANAAQNAAGIANGLISDMSNDNKLTAIEKHTILKEWNVIVGEKPKIDAEGTKFGVVLTTYTTKYTELSNYLTPLLTDINSTSVISGVDLRARFAMYYTTRQDVLNGITTKSKELANTAQGSANTAIANANTAIANAQTAQNTANTANTNATNAQTAANTANNSMADMSNDNKLTAIEKHSTKKEWDVIVGEKPKIDAEGTKFGVVLTAYGTAYTNLSTYVSPLLTDINTTSTMVGTDFRAKFAAYYSARQDVLNGITTRSKALADAAQTQANTAVTNAANAQTTANGKAKIFTVQPTPPYVIGDMWVGGPAGEIMRCIIARPSGIYTASDWDKASKYTDDSKANAVETSLNTTKSQVSSLQTSLTSITGRVSSVETTTGTINGQITSLTSRVTTAEQKITADAIVNTISTSTTSNGEPTFTKTSTLKQTVNDFRFEFSGATGRNEFARVVPPMVLTGAGSSIALEPYPDGYSGAVGGVKAYRWKYTDSNGSIRFPNVIMENGIYSLSFYVKSINSYSLGMSCDLADLTGTLSFTPALTGGRMDPNKWYLLKMENININNYSAVYNFLDISQTWSSSLAWDILISNIMINRGPKCLPWVEHSNEIYTANTVINSNGITINNGALTIKDGAGATMLNGDSTGNLYLKKGLTIGGSDNGIITIKNSANEVVGTMDNTGIKLQEQSLILRSNIRGGGHGPEYYEATFGPSGIVFNYERELSRGSNNERMIDTGRCSVFSVNGELQLNSGNFVYVDSGLNVFRNTYFQSNTYTNGIISHSKLNGNQQVVNVDGSAQMIYVGNPAKDITIESSGYIRSYGHIVPLFTRNYWLGTNSPDQQWKGVCCEGGTVGASDASYKENMYRLDGSSVILENNRLIKSAGSRSNKASSNDYYIFIKDRFIPTYYNYKLSKDINSEIITSSGPSSNNLVELENEYDLLKNIGFIAQDYNLETDSVAREFIFKAEDGTFRYNHMSYVTVGMVALQEATHKIEELINENTLLNERLIIIEKLLNI